MSGNALGVWIMGALAGLLGLVGLFLSAYAADGVMHATGMLIVGFSVFFIFALIGGHADEPEEVSAAGEGADGASHDEEIRPLAAEAGVSTAERVDATVEPGEVVVGALDKRTDALV